MAKIIKKIHGKREVRLTAGTGRLKGRTCVVAIHAVKKGAKGIHKSPFRFGGCFSLRSDALAKAQKLANKAS